MNNEFVMFDTVRFPSGSFGEANIRKEYFLAGAQAMQERCAEVAEADDTCECGCSSDYECNHCAIKKNIAAAIRRQG